MTLSTRQIFSSCGAMLITAGVMAIFMSLYFEMQMPSTFLYKIANVSILNIKEDKKGQTESTPPKTTSSKRLFKIVQYHPFHGGLIDHIRFVNMTRCVYKNCQLTQLFKIRNVRSVDADAVIFQGHHIVNKIPTRRDPNQVFIFQSVEAPQYLSFTDLNRAIFFDFFNLTMTYRLDSDFPIPYGIIIPATQNLSTVQKSLQTTLRQFYNVSYMYTQPKSQSRRNKNYSEIFSKKEKGASWLVSHCSTASKREKYVKALKNHTDIDVYGKCGNNTFCKKTNDCDHFVEENYKFYFSFENSMCKDYVTEKVFKWFSKDIITVVRGTFDYSTILPAGTYIDSSDFDTPEDLASYLNDLGSNETAYTEILRRKDAYMVISHKDVVRKAYCSLCEYLNINHKHKWIPDIHSWWRKDTCKQPKDI